MSYDENSPYLLQTPSGDLPQLRYICIDYSLEGCIESWTEDDKVGIDTQVGFVEDVLKMMVVQFDARECTFPQGTFSCHLQGLMRVILDWLLYVRLELRPFMDGLDKA
jgi:hypothetical protein